MAPGQTVTSSRCDTAEAAAIERDDPPRFTQALALVALASLFVRSDRYPSLFELGSLDVGLQDALFLILALAALRSGRSRIRLGPVGLVATGALLVVGAAAVRSPVRIEALISVAKLVEFVIVGAIVVTVVRRTGRPDRLTAVFAAGALANGLYGAANLVMRAGPEALLTTRASTLLGTEIAAVVGAAALVWGLVRLDHASSNLERRLALGALAGGALTLFVVKSVLSIAALPAVLAIALVLDRRSLPRVGLVVACIVVSIAVGRESDLSSFARSQTQIVGTQTQTQSQVQDEERDPRSYTSPGASRAENPSLVPDSALRGPVARHAAVIPEPGDLDAGSFVHRISLGYAGLQAFARRPWTGVGWLATSQPEALARGPADRQQLERFPRLDPNLFVSRKPANVHSAYVQLAAEGGVVALVLFALALSLATVVCAGRLIEGWRAPDPWALAGLGWLSLIAVYLHGNVLFGGTFNAAVLGAGLAIAGAVALPLRLRDLAAAAVLGAILILPAFAFLGHPASSPSPATAHVKLADDETGHEVFDAAHRFRRWSDATAGNGLVQVDGDASSLGITALAADGRPTGRRLPLIEGSAARPVTAAIVRRSGAGVTMLYGLATGDSLTVTVLYGVPGVYVTPHGRTGAAATAGVSLGAERAVFVRDRPARVFGASEFAAPQPLAAFASTAAILPGSALLVTAIPFSPAVIRGELGDQGPKGMFVAGPAKGPDTTFFGVTPIEGALGYGRRWTPSLPGRYLALRSRNGRWDAGVQTIQTGEPARWRRASDAALPFAIVDPAVTGSAEVVSRAVKARGEASPTVCRPPAGGAPLCR